ncbi:MAG TPA: CGNR zinc finger domain-containing protein [Acidimicrobiia bacterium]
MAGSMTSPPGLERLREFVNTRDIEAGTDVLATAEEGTAWLHDRGLLDAGEPLQPDGIERIVRFREIIRDALTANHDAAGLPSRVRDGLNEAIRRARLAPEIGARGVAMRPSKSGADGAIGMLLVPMLEAMTSGTWDRLKVCGNDACRWAFYDQSRSKGRKWCSMAVCGNRAKQDTWRASRSGASRQPTE